MAHITKDRVKETTTTTGTGALTLAGAATGYQAFSAVCSTGDTLYYALQAVDGSGAPTGDWEVGIGTYSGASTLTRTTVTASSNGGSVVNLSAGTKQVWLDISAGWVQDSTVSVDPTALPSQGSIIYRSATHWVALAPGTAGQALLTGGAGANPTWGSPSAAVSLSGITAATAANTISSGDHAQTWRWALTTANKTAFSFSESAASTSGAGSQHLVAIDTAAGSTANPLYVASRGSQVILAGYTGSTTVQGATRSGAFEDGGALTLAGGNGGSFANGGAVSLKSGMPGSGGAYGSLAIQGEGVSISNYSTAAITLSTVAQSFGNTAGVSVSTGAAGGGGSTAGSITLAPGSGGAIGANHGGSVNLNPGASSGGGTPGAVVIGGSGRFKFASGSYIYGVALARKTAAQSVSPPSSVVSDSHLTFSIGASEEWMGECVLDAGVALSSTGIKLSLDTPTGSTVNVRVAVHPDAISSGVYRKSTTTVAGVVDFAAADLPSAGSASVRVEFWVLNGGTAGSVTLKFAPSAASGSDVTLAKGSHLLAHRVA